jgi:hypothetical protein
MNIILNKELLSEVLNIENERISKKVDRFCFLPTSNIIAVGYYMEDGWQHLNIHELVYNCKEWAFDKDIVLSTEKSRLTGLWYCNLFLPDNNTLYPSISNDFDSETEPEAVFAACLRMLKHETN